MANDIRDAVKHVVKEEHLKAGSEVSNDTAMTMLNDVWREVYAKQHKYSDAPVSASSMKVAADELSKELKAYGIKDIEFYDSNNDGKADKNDAVAVKKGIIFGNSDYKLGDRPTAAEPGPMQIRQIKEYNKDPRDIKIQGY